jgi:hypothetical protein
MYWIHAVVFDVLSDAPGLVRRRKYGELDWRSFGQVFDQLSGCKRKGTQTHLKQSLCFERPASLSYTAATRRKSQRNAQHEYIDRLGALWIIFPQKSYHQRNNRRPNLPSDTNQWKRYNGRSLNGFWHRYGRFCIPDSASGHDMVATFVSAILCSGRLSDPRGTTLFVMNHTIEIGGFGDDQRLQLETNYVQQLQGALLCET